MEALDTAIKAAGGVNRLADRLGVRQSVVSNWRARKSVPPEHCAAIEKAVDGAVTRRELCPDDWHRIWPELVTAEHPAPAEKAAA